MVPIYLPLRMPTHELYSEWYDRPMAADTHRK